MSPRKRLVLAAGVAALLAGVFWFSPRRDAPTIPEEKRFATPLDEELNELEQEYARRFERFYKLHPDLPKNCPEDLAERLALQVEYRDAKRRLYRRHGAPLPAWLTNEPPD